MQFRDNQGRFRAISPEIKAIGVGLKGMESLSLKAQKRVVQYLYSSVTKTVKQIFPREEVAGED